MREIKFRAWDTKKKEMLSGGACDHYDGWESGCTRLFIEFSGEVVGMCGDDGGKNGLHEHYEDVKERFILMQYTGLKDRNGKEIYEGDVVLMDGITYEAQWEAGPDTHCWTLIDHKDGMGYSLSSTGDEGYEVIGNIYENPELLK